MKTAKKCCTPWSVCSLLLGVLMGAGMTGSSMAAEPLGVPDMDTIEYPDGEPPSKQAVDLGRVLFFDTRLSSNDKFSCASCHNPDLGFGDGLALGLGTMGGRLGRNVPHIYNLAWNVIFFWDGRSPSLEDQALGPIAAPGEMNLPLQDLVPKLRQIPFYVRTFAAIYPDSGLTIDIGTSNPGT